MIISPDYGQEKLKGLTFYGDFDFTHHIGVEGDIHYSIFTPQDISENTYLFGPRYTFRKKNLGLYAKVLFGIGRFGLQEGSFANPSTATYGVYDFGGGVEYMVTRNINIRPFDYEFEVWPGFGQNGLTPMSYTFGAAYVFR